MIFQVSHAYGLGVMSGTLAHLQWDSCVFEMGIIIQECLLHWGKVLKVKMHTQAAN